MWVEKLLQTDLLQSCSSPHLLELLGFQNDPAKREETSLTILDPFELCYRLSLFFQNKEAAKSSNKISDKNTAITDILKEYIWINVE